MTQAIRLETRGPIGEIILHKPDKRNALSQDMWAAIPDLVASAENAEGVRALLIHGGQTGVFAAGADISEFEAIYADAAAAERSNQVVSRALDAIAFSPLPSIAAIEGICIGGGVSLAMAADMRIAGRGARFAVPPAKLGLIYPASHTRRLLQAIGPGATKDIIFSGRIFDGPEAFRMGLIEQIVGDGEAIHKARAFCQNMSENSQWTLRATKQLISGLLCGWTDDGQEVQALEAEGFSNADFQEGYRAFLAKRPTNFPL